MARARAYSLSHERFTCTAVSVMEILSGLHHRDARRQLERTKASLSRNQIVLPTLEDYQTAGRIRGLARWQGIQLGSEDCLIGAVAHRLGLPVATGDTARFEAIRRAGLDIAPQNWREAF